MFFRKRVTGSSPVTIGVCSFQHNAGVTCFCIALSNYLCSKKKYPTAYVEINTTGEITELSPNHIQSRNSYDFFLKGVHYYPEVTLHTLPDIYSANTQYYILDFGIISAHTQSEFQRCKQKYVLCAPAPWKFNQFSRQFSEWIRNNKLQESITLLVNMGIQDSDGNCCRKLKKQFRNRIIFLPILTNPFLITSNEFEVFEKILKGV